MVFLGIPRTEKSEKAAEVHLPMLIGPGLMAIGCIALGVFSLQIFNAFGLSLPLPDLLFLTIFMAAIGAVVLLFSVIFTNNKVRESETWGCGIIEQNSKMQYTPQGFSEPVMTIFKFIYKPKTNIEKNYLDRGKLIFYAGSAELFSLKFFEEKLYLPIARAARKISALLSKLQNTDSLDAFILVTFMTIISLLAIGGFFS
jgi:hypothetical protein